MIGILPAAGQATRIHGLPKYLLPIPGGYLLDWHIRAMRSAGLQDIKIGTNPGSFDLIFDCKLDANLYLAQHYETMTQTVLSCHNREDTVLFGMPDTYFDSVSVYRHLRQAIDDNADVAVALFEARPDQHHEGGMCTVADGRVTAVVDKPDQPSSPYIWGALAWQPIFWDCLNPDDPHVGYGLPRAIERGLDVHAVHCSGGFWDCGTPERYFACIRHLTEETYVPAHRA